MRAMRLEKKVTISSSRVAPLKLRELTLHSIIAPKAFTLFAMLGGLHYLPHSGPFAVLEALMLFIEVGTLCGTRTFYFICHTWDLIDTKKWTFNKNKIISFSLIVPSRLLTITQFNMYI